MSCKKRMEYHDWEEMASLYYFTIADFLDMKEGDTLAVLILDRNVLDICDSVNNSGIHDPEVFFRQNRHTIVKQSDFQWVIELHKSWGVPKDHEPTEIYVYHKETQVWHPVDGKGNIDVIEEKTADPETWQTYCIHWSELPKNTPIGWRGPMIPWTDVNKMPQIIWSADA